MKTQESPTNPHAAGKAAHLSVALRNLAVNSLDRDTQNHLHALANDAYELSNSHAALVEALKCAEAVLDSHVNDSGSSEMCSFAEALETARAALSTLEATQ